MSASVPYTIKYLKIAIFEKELELEPQVADDHELVLEWLRDIDPEAWKVISTNPVIPK